MHAIRSNLFVVSKKQCLIKVKNYSHDFISCTMNSSLPTELRKINCGTKNKLVLQQIKNASSCTHCQNKSESTSELVNNH